MGNHSRTSSLFSQPPQINEFSGQIQHSNLAMATVAFKDKKNLSKASNQDIDNRKLF